MTPLAGSLDSMNLRVNPELIDAAATVLALLLRWQQPADAQLSAFFRSRRELGGRERGFIAEAVYLVLRRLRLLQKMAGPAATPRRLLLAALSALDGRSLRQLTPGIGVEEAEWLAALRARPEPELDFAEQCDFPDWLIDSLRTQLGDADILCLARALNQAAPLDLRVNSLLAKPEEVLASLAADGIAATPCAYSPVGLRLGGKPALQKHALFLSGAVEVQDEGSQLLCFLLAPKRSELVVDFCAGAGGKTLALGAMMRSSGRLYAFDIAEKRLAKMKPRLARAGLSNVHPVRIAGENDSHVKRLAGKIDRVLVDAPCSGLGTLRRNPDLKWRQSPQSVAELTRKQAAILASAARLVKPGGRLVYATCSILRAENEDIVAGFLAAHPDFTVDSAQAILAAQGIAIDCGDMLQLSPLQHGTDGFFAAVLRRAALPAQAKGEA